MKKAEARADFSEDPFLCRRGRRGRIAIMQERESEPELSPDQKAQLDRRSAEPFADPESAIPWGQVRRKLRDVR